MTDILENRIRLLEKEIQEKNQLIATLQTISVPSILLRSYMHEMNNRIGHLSLLLSSHFEICRENGIDKYINNITEAFADLAYTIDTIQDLFWRRQENKVGIEECVQAAIKFLEPHLKHLDIVLKLELDTNSGNIRVPELEFTNVLLVVLINAINALQDVRYRERVILIKTMSDDKSTSIAITDNGHGIDDNIITKIWEPGFPTKGYKSGLGMAWVKTFVVELLGGQITIESELGESTKINIILPEKQEQKYENTPMD